LTGRLDQRHAELLRIAARPGGRLDRSGAARARTRAV